MNRSALKLPCAMLFGVAVGWGIRGMPSWNGGAGGTEARPVAAGAQAGAGADYRSGPAGSANETGTAPAGGKPGRDRLEMLAAGFRNKTEGEDETMMAMDVVVRTSGMSAEEFGPLMALLAEEGMDPQTLELLSARWAMLDPKAALAFALDRDELIRTGNSMSSIMNELAKVDVPAAKAALTRLEGDERRNAERAIVRVLQQRNIRTALAYARELGNAQAERQVLRKWSESDPLAAGTELAAGNEDHRQLAGQIARRLAAKDRHAFEVWAENLADPSLRAMARCAVLDMDASQNPKDAARSAAAWLAREPEGSSQAGPMSQNLARSWMEAKGPPSEVAAWAAGLPEGPARDSAVRETVRLWLERDTLAASAWLGTLPQSKGRDHAVLQLVQKISGENPADAFEWARTIGTSERSDAQKEAVQSWTKQDPNAALQAVEALPASDRVYLRDILEAAKEEREQATEGK